MISYLKVPELACQKPSSIDCSKEALDVENKEILLYCTMKAAQLRSIKMLATAPGVLSQELKGMTGEWITAITSIAEIGKRA